MARRQRRPRANNPQGAARVPAPSKTTGSLSFLNAVAHQIRSPLSTVLASLEAVLGGRAEQISSRNRQLLEGARRKGHEALSMATDLLRLARLESPEAAAPAPLYLQGLMEKAVQSAEIEARAKNQKLSVHLPEKLPTVTTNVIALSEILENLVDNAIRYTPSGGRVMVRMSYDKNTQTLHGEVADTGIGIPAADQKVIFDEFYRASNARKEVPSGTGLGLTIVSRALRLLGGRIDVRSEAGEGSTFRFSVPMPLVKEARREAEKPKASLRVVVIGGVAAGPKAAAKIRRLDPRADITIVERGHFLSYAGCGLPYYISGKVKSQRDLMTSPVGESRDPEFFKVMRDIEALSSTEATDIDRDRREVKIRDLRTGETWSLPYDRLILATGSRAKVPRIPGAGLKNVYTLHKVEDAEGLRRELHEARAKDAVVVGAGLLGTEISEALTEGGARVTIVEAEDKILPMLDPDMAALVQRHLERKGVRILTGQKITRLRGKGGAVSAVVTEEMVIRADFVILAVGVRPNVELAARAGLSIGITGAIAVDDHMRTSDPNIYAVGDCVENTDLVTGKKIYLPLGSTANKHGRVAGINVAGGNESFPGIVRTVIMKAFDYTVGVAGLTETQARREGFAPVSVLVPAPDRDHYYPAAKMIIVKLVAERSSRRILGAQIIGPGEVAKRTDVVACLLFQRGTVEQLAKLDLAYAPPYSSAMDNVVTAANVLQNKLAGDFVGLQPMELKAKLDRKEEVLLMDVRDPDQYAEATIPGAISVPFGALRGRLGELPRDRQIVVISHTGLLAYQASLVLRSGGLKEVCVLEGGITAWPFEIR